jgi:hypothetical protein
VTASAWINDLRNQIEQTRILSTVYRSASALGSRLPSIASARAKVAGAGAMLQPVSNGTQVLFLLLYKINPLFLSPEVGHGKLNMHCREKLASFLFVFYALNKIYWLVLQSSCQKSTFFNAFDH